uniref:Uncharacterized protein n=1 Tax=Nothobranchius furzeri TaxID=105023 RepID=A0A1A8AKG9_NOTFU
MGEFKSSALGRVTVYSIQGCPRCVQAKATLKGLGVPVCDVDVGAHSKLRGMLTELTGHSTVPQIFFNHVYVAAELSLLLREITLKLFSEHLSDDGKSVDYSGMCVNPGFARYCELAVQLQRVELLSLSRDEKLAFFINIYNALVIHGFLRLGAPTNLWQRYRVGLP